MMIDKKTLKLALEAADKLGDYTAAFIHDAVELAAAFDPGLWDLIDEIAIRNDVTRGQAVQQIVLKYTGERMVDDQMPDRQGIPIEFSRKDGNLISATELISNIFSENYTAQILQNQIGKIISLQRAGELTPEEMGQEISDMFDPEDGRGK